MANSHRNARRTRRHGTVLTALVLALSAILLTVSAQLARSSGTARHPESVAQLVTQRAANVATLTTQVTDLTGEISALAEAQGANEEVAAPNQPAEDLATGGRAVTGPGIQVTLADAKTDQIPEGAVADDLVVHQQDLQAVMNALWRGGAEAMTLQGRRVTTTSAVRCVGNVLYLQGQIYSPPYEVAAIGDPQALRAAVDADQWIDNYLEYVKAYGLGWDVTEVDTIDMPASDGSARPQFAQVTDPSVVEGIGAAAALVTPTSSPQLRD